MFEKALNLHTRESSVKTHAVLNSYIEMKESKPKPH